MGITVLCENVLCKIFFNFFNNCDTNTLKYKNMLIKVHSKNTNDFSKIFDVRVKAPTENHFSKAIVSFDVNFSSFSIDSRQRSFTNRTQTSLAIFQNIILKSISSSPIPAEGHGNETCHNCKKLYPKKGSPQKRKPVECNLCHRMVHVYCLGTTGT